MREHYKIDVTKDFLVFSAAHFITFNGNICERLHGHNYRVRIEIEGPLDENSYVYDFIALLNIAKDLCQELDHHVILPTQSKLISVETVEEEVIARFEQRRWVFPKDDCKLLPVANTTVELLGRYLGLQLQDRWLSAGHPIPPVMRVHVEENFGQWAVCELRTDEIG